MQLYSTPKTNPRTSCSQSGFERISHRVYWDSSAVALNADALEQRKPHRGSRYMQHSSLRNKVRTMQTPSHAVKDSRMHLRMFYGSQAGASCFILSTEHPNAQSARTKAGKNTGNPKYVRGLPKEVHSAPKSTDYKGTQLR